MNRAQFIVGGEQVFPPGIIFNKNYHQFSNYGANLLGYWRYYTFGAYYSFKVIYGNLNLAKDDFVLLPSYLCPSMIYPLKEAGIRYDFYKMKEGLLPDIEDIDRKNNNSLKAVLFIDYFGFSYKNYLRSIVSSLRAKGIAVIQDAVQSWLDNEDVIYADYCVNSLRKISPFEGSVLFSKKKLQYKSAIKPIFKFIWHKRIAQILRYYHINYACFKADSFLKHIDKANKAYHQREIIGLPKSNASLLNRVDFYELSKNRKHTYNTLMHEFELDLIISLYLAEATPLGIPIYLNERNQKKKLLHELNIHCPVHWLLDDDINKKEHEYSWELQAHELTIPINVAHNMIPEYTQKLKEVL